MRFHMHLAVNLEKSGMRMLTCARRQIASLRSQVPRFRLSCTPLANQAQIAGPEMRRNRRLSRRRLLKSMSVEALQRRRIEGEAG